MATPQAREHLSVRSKYGSEESDFAPSSQFGRLETEQVWPSYKEEVKFSDRKLSEESTSPSRFRGRLCTEPQPNCEPEDEEEALQTARIRGRRRTLATLEDAQQDEDKQNRRLVVKKTFFEVAAGHSDAEEDEVDALRPRASSDPGWHKQDVCSSSDGGSELGRKEGRLDAEGDSEVDFDVLGLTDAETNTEDGCESEEEEGETDPSSSERKTDEQPGFAESPAVQPAQLAFDKLSQSVRNRSDLNLTSFRAKLGSRELKSERDQSGLANPAQLKDPANFATNLSALRGRFPSCGSNELGSECDFKEPKLLPPSPWPPSAKATSSDATLGLGVGAGLNPAVSQLLSGTAPGGATALAGAPALGGAGGAGAAGGLGRTLETGQVDLNRLVSENTHLAYVNQLLKENMRLTMENKMLTHGLGSGGAALPEPGASQSPTSLGSPTLSMPLPPAAMLSPASAFTAPSPLASATPLAQPAFPTSPLAQPALPPNPFAMATPLAPTSPLGALVAAQASGALAAAQAGGAGTHAAANPSWLAEAAAGLFAGGVPGGVQLGGAAAAAAMAAAMATATASAATAARASDALMAADDAADGLAAPKPEPVSAGRRRRERRLAAARNALERRDNDAAAAAAGLSPQAPEAEEAAEMQPMPGRTTVMLRNLPNNYNRQMVLSMLDGEGFSGQYDFLYLPIDFKSKACLGYAFVNLVSPQVVLTFRRKFNGFSNWVLPSRKVCGVSWSGPHQGLEAHVERYRNSPVMHTTVPEEYKPVIFDKGVRMAFPPPSKNPQAPRIRNLRAASKKAGGGIPCTVDLAKALLLTQTPLAPSPIAASVIFSAGP